MGSNATKGSYKNSRRRKERRPLGCTVASVRRSSGHCEHCDRVLCSHAIEKVVIDSVYRQPVQECDCKEEEKGEVRECLQKLENPLLCLAAAGRKRSGRVRGGRFGRDRWCAGR